MKRFFFLMAFSALFAACKTENKQITSDFIHFPPSNGATSNEKVPVITFDSTTINFGTLAIGASYDHTFRFTNTGTAPLSLTQVSPSCGCTVPNKWSMDPIGPGETGEISVTFNSKGNSGKVEKSITVATNCIPQYTQLIIKGQVIGVEAQSNDKIPIEMEMERR
ncbi:MAG: hypothetical protein RLZZ262_1048 [Bacteroidota bacterium]|jgi:hypothetical protein